MIGTAAPAPTGADPATLVDAAMRSLNGNYGCRDDEIRAFPAIQAIIIAPDEVRRQCILAAARAEQWPGTRLPHHIARKQARLALDDIEEILPPPVSQRDSNQCYRDACKLASVVSQIEATWKCLDDGRAGKLFLPFDDDPVLSLILSKAFLLAEDTKITDPSITRQMRGR